MKSVTAARQRTVPRADLTGEAMVRETIAISMVLCLLVPALLPLTRAGMAATHDGLLHVQRLIALDQAIRQGTPFTRWLPDLAYGYGQPLLLYYAPLAYVPALVAHTLGLGYVASYNVATGLALIGSALAMYLLARSLFSVSAAVATAVVYVMLPYQLVDVYVRGALAESWAFVWLPLAVWCLLKLHPDTGPRWAALLAASVAGLVLTHNVTALLFLPVLCVLAVCLALSNRAGGLRHLAASLLAIGGGLLLSAWFWLPALAERSLVQIGETIEPELFASFFLRTWPPFRLDLLYDYQRPVSTALGAPIFWPQLGIVQVLVSIVGMIGMARLTGTRQVVAIWATLLVVCGLLLQLQPFTPVYESVPLLAFVQFPWRLLALVGLGSALLAGALVESVGARADLRLGFATVVVGFAILTALGRLNPEVTPIDETKLSSQSILRSELADYGLGATHSGEYLPVSSGQRNASRFRKTLLDAGGGQERSGDAPIPIRIESVDWRPDRIVADVTASAPARLALHQFVFPGWGATLDGQTAPIVPTGPLGLVGIDVPAGRHVVEIAWGWTPLRLAATGVFLLALAVAVALAAARSWRPTLRPILFGLVVAGAVGALVVPTWPALSVTRGPAIVSGGWQPVDDSLALVDSHVDTSRLRSDRLVAVSNVWLATSAASGDGRAVVEVVSSRGGRMAADWLYEPLRRLWGRGELVRTTTSIGLSADFPAGEATLRLRLERPEGTGAVVLGTLIVPEPRGVSTGSLIDMAPEPQPGLRLLSARAQRSRFDDPGVIRSGGPLDVDVTWTRTGAEPSLTHDLLVVAAVQAPGGDVVSEPRRPGDWFSPLPFWKPEEVVEQRLRIGVPRGVMPGSYPLVVRVYRLDLARGGLSETGASSARPRGRPLTELQLGEVTIVR